MKLSRRSAKLLLVATLCQMLFVFGLVGIMIAGSIVTIRARANDPKNFQFDPVWIVAFFSVEIVFIAVNFALIALYLVYIFQSESLTGGVKAAWVLAVLFGGFIGM